MLRTSSYSYLTVFLKDKNNGYFFKSGIFSDFVVIPDSRFFLYLRLFGANFVSLFPRDSAAKGKGANKKSSRQKAPHARNTGVREAGVRDVMDEKPKGKPRKGSTNGTVKRKLMKSSG